MTGHKPTAEQQAAIDGFRTGNNMVIEAAAGSGKTSTLRFIADAGADKSMLYVAFNKGIAQDAERRFQGTNVSARTGHSLAFQKFGRDLMPRINGVRMTASEKAELLGIRTGLRAGGVLGQNIRKGVVARLVSDTVNRYCRTDTTEFTNDLVDIPVNLMLSEDQATDLSEQILHIAKRYWDDLINPDGVLPATHDVYMKLWSLSNPRLDTDVILFDEAQDADGVIASVVKAQTHAQVVAVGDRAQAIYGWRGATDSMDWFGGDTYQLTQSFRFGDAIADEANQWLALLGSTMRVVGTPGKPSSVHHTHKRVPEAVLCRTNGTALAEVIDAHERGVPVAIAGQGRAVALKRFAEAAKQLIEKGWTSHPEFDTFTSWDQVVEFSEEDEGADLAPFVRLVDRYGPDRIITAIDRCVPVERARTVIATAHVAKGLEWHHIRIADDFKLPDFDDETGNLIPLTDADLMLNYVAVTRAQRHLDPGGLVWVRDYRRALARPELGAEFRRREYARRAARAEQIMIGGAA